MKRILNYSLFVWMFLAGSVALSAQEEATAASLYNDGVAKYKEQDYAGAMELFEQALEIADPSSDTDSQVIGLAKKNGAVAAYRAATTKRKEKEYDAAIRMYEKGMEWAPESYSNFLGRALTLDRKGEDTEAVKAYLKAAEVAEAAGKADKAEQYVAKAEVTVEKAAVSKNWDQVFEMAEAFGDRESADLHNCMTRAYIAKNDGLQALKHAQKAVGMATKEQDKFQFYLAKAYEANGETGKAAKAYSEVPQGKYYENAQYKAKELSGDFR